MSLFVLLNTKEDILKNVGSQTVDGTPNHSIWYSRKKQWKSMGLVTNIKISFCVQWKKKNE